MTPEYQTFKTNRFMTFGLACQNLKLIKINYIEILDHIGIESLNQLVESMLFITYHCIETTDGHPKHWDNMLEDLINFNKQFV